MLRRVPLEEVRLGMFVHALEGSWLQHPFWRRRFLLDSEQDLQRLRDSDIPGIIIDDERGAAPAPPEIDSTPIQPTAAAPAPAPRRERQPRPSGRAVQDETERARNILGKSRRAVMKMFGDVRMGRAIEVGGIAPMVEEIAASVTRNSTTLIGIARLKRKDEYTYMHSVAVCALMINFARTLELDEGLVHELGLAGLLHDIGKMAVPEPVLNKPGRLSDDEFAIVREHPQRGYDLVVASPEAPAIAAEVVLHHHEKYDGSGYPHGLKGEQISLYARMGAICDVYDAITSDRPYKEGWAPADSIARMLEWQGHFDQRLLDVFIRSIGIYPVGSIVRLRSNRLGLVVAENKREPTRPKVSAFYAIPERALIRPELVSIGPSLREDSIIRPEHPEHWNLGDWPNLRADLLSH